MFDRILIPLATLLFTTFTATIALYWLLVLKAEVRRVRSGSGSKILQLEKQTEVLRQKMAELQLRMDDAEERSGVLVPPSPPKSGLNLSRRTQVIRMSRRGEPPENIAASLNLPKQEVELLLKVHHMAVDGHDRIA